MSFNGIINHCITALIAFLFSTYNILLCNAFNKQSKMLDGGCRYVGRQFASLKCIANDGKAFTIDDGCVNRKKT